MTTQPSQKQPVGGLAPTDDPMVISAIYFRDPVPIGGHGCEEWTLRGLAQNQYHGRSRVEEMPYGVLVIYKTGKHYEEIKVPWGNLRNITAIPMSSLDGLALAMYVRLQTEIRR